MKNNFHVVPNDGHWQVKRENSGRASKNFNKQSEAIDFAKKAAIKDKSEVVIHGRDGRIRDKDSYGNDHCPPRDTKF